MLRRPSLADWICVLLTGFALVTSLAVWPELPDSLATHFTSGGTPDATMPKAIGVVAIPAVMLLTVGIMNGAARIDPPSSPLLFPVFKVVTTAFLGGVHVVVLAWNIGIRWPMDYVLPASLLFGAVMVGIGLAAEYRWGPF
jgi:uncharacterized membrane protein